MMAALFSRIATLIHQRTLLLAVLSVFVIGVVVWMVIPRESSTAPVSNLASLTVTAALPREVEWDTTLDASGAVAPWQEAIIGAQVAGLILFQLEADVGDRVQRGQLLARFDTATLRAEETQLMAAVAEAEGAKVQATANRERVLRLKGSGSISEQEIQRYVTEAVIADAQLAAAHARLDAKRLQLRQADIVASDDGVISARVATLGSVSTAGQELFRLVRQGKLEWRGEFTATQLARIEIGQTVNLYLPEGQVGTARVRQIAPLLNTRSRLGLVYADIEPGEQIRGGMYVDGLVTLASSSAWVVPAASVVIRDGRSIVFLLQPDGEEYSVQAQAVVVGRRQGSEIEILEGLVAGLPVVARGAGLLVDGDRVKIEPTVAVSAANLPVGSASREVQQ